MTCGWIIGRGASIAHGIAWTVTESWYAEYLSGKRTREKLIESIAAEMRSQTNGTNPSHYAKMIETLLRHTALDQLHYLTTTNWDYLGQLALDQHRETHGELSIPYNTVRGMIHLNGSAEPGQWVNRSQFVLEVDDQAKRRRIWSVEGQQGFEALLIADTLVIVGLSFECADDRGFVNELARQRTLGTHEGALLVLVDPNQDVLTRNHEFLLRTFQKVTVEEIPMGFDQWVGRGLPTSKVPIFHR